MGSEVRLTESELRPQLHGSCGPRSLASGFQLVYLLVKGNLPVRAIGWIKGDTYVGFSAKIRGQHVR